MTASIPAATAAALIAALCAITAVAQDSRDISGSTVTLRETDTRGAAAEVLFQNRDSNSHDDNQIFVLRWNGIEAQVEFIWNGHAPEDQIIVEAPGYVAVPRGLSLVENTEGVVTLYPIEGVGF